jgi:WD40 repeat protein
MYLLDMIHTKGHVAGLTKALFHPTDPTLCCSSAFDGTIRIWNTEDTSKQIRVIKSKALRGMRTPVTTCVYSPDGKTIASATLDGQLQLWSTSSSSIRPSLEVREAHEKESHTSCLAFSTKDGGNILVSRGGDQTMKVWDIRKFRQPLLSLTGLLNNNQSTDCIFSPDEKLIITGTSVAVSNKEKDNASTAKIPSGFIHFFDSSTLENVSQVAVSPGTGVVSLLWHPKINQLIAGCTDSSAHLFYDPKISKNGALLPVKRAPRKRNIDDVLMDTTQVILTPNALPLFRTDEVMSVKKRREKERKDPVKSNKPNLTVSGPGRAGSTLTQHMIKNLVKKNDRAEDPREALLKYAKAAEENPQFFGAYKKTQPQTLFDYEDDEEEEKK